MMVAQVSVCVCVGSFLDLGSVPLAYLCFPEPPTHCSWFLLFQLFTSYNFSFVISMSGTLSKMTNRNCESRRVFFFHPTFKSITEHVPMVLVFAVGLLWLSVNSGEK